jgi:hypothetical protein
VRSRLIGTKERAALVVHAVDELVTVGTGATTDTVMQIPAGAIVIAGSAAVEVALPSGTTFQLLAKTTGEQLTGDVPIALGSADPGTKAGVWTSAVQQKLQVKPASSPSSATGRVRVTLMYLLSETSDHDAGGFTQLEHVRTARGGQAQTVQAAVSFQSPIDLGGNKITSLADPTTEQDAVTRHYQNMHGGGRINVTDYAPPGTLRDGTVDWTTYIQDAVDAAIDQGIASGTVNAVPVYLPPGRYKITSPILLAKQVAGPAYDFVSVELIGDSAPLSNIFHGSVILPNYVNKPAIAIEGARAVRIKRLAIVGLNSWTSSFDPSDPENLYDDSHFVMASCRNNRYSPYAAIAIDPFDTAAIAGDQYPGMSSSYVTGAASSNVLIEDCYISGFVVGIGIGLSQVLQNAENIRIADTQIASVKSGVVIGQSQSRAVSLQNVSIFGAHYCVDATHYGQRGGDCPAIFGSNFGGSQQLFAVSSVGGTPSINGLYCESFLRMGQFAGGQGNDGYVFNGCNFTFFSTPAGHTAVDAHLIAACPITFLGCNFANSSSDREPIRIANPTGHLTFIGCHFGINSPDMAPSVWITGAQERVRFENCLMEDLQYVGFQTKTTLSSFFAVDNLANFHGYQVLPGALYHDVASHVSIRWVSGVWPKVSLGSLAVTANGDGTGSFTAADGSILRAGDLIYSTHSYSVLEFPLDATPTTVIIGKIASVVGNVVTLEFMPESVVSATLALYLVYLPRVHVDNTSGAMPRSTGDVSSGTNTILNVTSPTLWHVGQRIQAGSVSAKLFADGTYVTNVSGTTITTSKNATGSGTGADLFDADVYELTMSAT